MKTAMLPSKLLGDTLPLVSELAIGETGYCALGAFIVAQCVVMRKDFTLSFRACQSIRRNCF